MTEVEFSSLLSKLTDTAKVLNKKSDSINDVIKACEAKLGQVNLGLTVWLSDNPLASEITEEEDRDGEWHETGTIDDELGFTMWGHGDWRLAVRRATYKYEANAWGINDTIFKNEESPTPLLECSRQKRIEAIKRFPDLVKLMNREAEAAVEAIEAAKTLVTESGQ